MYVYSRLANVVETQTMTSTEGNRKGLTAAIIIIGDEILKGHIQDTNSHYLCHQLWLLGVKVGTVSVVPDGLEVIAEEVRRLSPRYDFILTTGGVGPTHDDITLEAVGMAFDEELCLHRGILKILFGDENTDDKSNPWRKMAIVPKSTKVHVRPDSKFSFILFSVRNVHCYPGVPSLMRSVFQQCKDLYSHGSTTFYLKEVFFSCSEGILAQPLSQVQQEFASVQLGSYPSDSSSESYQVKVTLESDNQDLVEWAYARLILLLPSAVLMSAKSTYEAASPPAVRGPLSWFLEKLPVGKASAVPTRLCERIHQSLQTMEKALEQYRFEEICVAFNGGKDCTVILALLHSLLQKRGHDVKGSKLKVLYVGEPESFPETEDFVWQSAKRYSLDIIELSGPIKVALSQLQTDHPELKAIVMGTRHTDPYSADLDAFAPTDDSWPQYMRVNTILEWSYHDVWLFMKLFEVPYCKLYDQGYTSLDGATDTHPNPALLLRRSPRPDGHAHSKQGSNSLEANHDNPDTGRYSPAYMLSDEGLERAGRNDQTTH